MAKVTIDGNIYEGTTEELVDLFTKMGAEFPGADGEPEIITHKDAQYKRVQRKAREGDVVVFTENTSVVVDNGKPYGPVSLSNDGELVISNIATVYREAYNRMVDNVKVYEPVEVVAAAPAPLKVGDYAKVVGFTGLTKKFNGLIVSLEKEWNSDDGRFNVKSIVKSAIASCSVDNLVKATDEEVAEAKATTKWAAIGRKPNEFKAGDIVRGLRNLGDYEIITGEMGDNGKPDANGHYGITSFVDGDYRSVRNVELITPVERRFDRG